MPLPINKREFDVFLSHAHKDKRYVDELDQWLSEIAGMNVWYDAREFSGGSMLATDLQQAIERCRGILIVASGVSLSQGWVKAEYNSAMDERANNEDFRVVALRIGDADVSSLMKGVTWIEVPEEGLTEDIAFSIILAFYPGEKRPKPSVARDVYISCSWRHNESNSANAVSRTLIEQGFRLIGDSKDQKGFGSGDRVHQIISSCGALVSIIPYREEEIADSEKSPYKYFLREIDYAESLGLPVLVIADPRIKRSDASDKEWLRMETDSQLCPISVSCELEELWNLWVKPPTEQYVFCAMDLDSSAIRAMGPVRQLIERVTGMRTVVGNEIHEQPLNAAVMKAVCNAFVVIADISEDNINSCIEAGMGLAVETNVHLISYGKPRRPPFMLRAIQMPTYENDVERIGILHSIVRSYRRRVINAEL
mgnify:CR=1 FL=1